MAFIQISPLTNKEAKTGSSIVFPGEDLVFWKIQDTSHCKTGKHGAAKSIMNCKTLRGEPKNRKVVFPGPETIMYVNDFGYTHRVIYDFQNNDILVNLETEETIHLSKFGKQMKEVEEEIKKIISEGGVKDSAGRPLVVKYSEVPDAKEGAQSLFFWEFKYYTPEELPSKGINDYVA